MLTTWESKQRIECHPSQVSFSLEAWGSQINDYCQTATRPSEGTRDALFALNRFTEWVALSEESFYEVLIRLLNKDSE